MWAIGILSLVRTVEPVLAKDARHRLAAIHTFVGMRFRGQLDENAGRALFRFLLTPSPTGLLRGAEVHPLLRVLGDGARKATKTEGRSGVDVNKRRPGHLRLNLGCHRALMPRTRGAAIACVNEHGDRRHEPGEFRCGNQRRRRQRPGESSTATSARCPSSPACRPRIAHSRSARSATVASFSSSGKARAHHAAHRAQDACVATAAETALHLNAKFHLASQLRQVTTISLR